MKSKHDRWLNNYWGCCVSAILLVLSFDSCPADQSDSAGVSVYEFSTLLAEVFGAGASGGEHHRFSCMSNETAECGKVRIDLGLRMNDMDSAVNDMWGFTVIESDRSTRIVIRVPIGHHYIRPERPGWQDRV